MNRQEEIKQNYRDFMKAFDEGKQVGNFESREEFINWWSFYWNPETGRERNENYGKKNPYDSK